MKKYFFLSFFLIAIDQLIKYIVVQEKITNSFLYFICNKNVAWSIPIAPGVFYFLWITIFLLLIYFFLQSKHLFEKIALIFLLSGAISNLIDRITHGCVVDFIDLKVWPLFNLADIYITIGISLLIVIYIKYKILDTKY